MDISLRDLAAVCGSNNPLGQELIQKVDQITHTYGVVFDKGKSSLCSQVWHLIANSLEFWANASMLLAHSQFTETKLQVLLLIQNRVKSNWINQDPTIKDGIKKYLCNQSQTYSNGEMNNTRKSLFRVINRIIVQILKYQWMVDWANFLYEICQAITSNPLLAQNYFDLLYVIFDDIFAQEEKLTSQEIKKIREQIINNYNIIQKAFQQYLSPQTPKNVLKNCVLGLDSLIQWLPSYYIYFGLIIDKLIHLFQISTDMKIQLLSCLITILELPNDEMIEGILSKTYDKKRETILTLLQNRNLKSNREIVSKMLSMSQNFLKSQKNDVEKFGQNLVFPDNNSMEANKEILVKIEDWMSAADPEEDKLLSIYKYISLVTGEEQRGGVQNLIENIIDFTPCPLNIQYFATQKIISMDFSDDGQYEEERKNYKEIVKNIVQRLGQNEYKNYFKYLRDELSSQCTNLPALKRLCRLVWNFYYFVQACPMSAKQVVIMEMINGLVDIQEAARQSVLQTPNTIDVAKRRDFTFKLVGVVKLCTVLLASLSCIVKKQSFINPLIAYVEQGFLQNNDFIKGVLCIIRKNYQDFQIDRKKQINTTFAKAMANRKNRLQLDIQYIKLVGSWVLINPSNVKLGLELLLVVFQPYQQKFLYTNNKCLSRKEDVEFGKTQLFESGLEMLTFISQSTPFLKSEIIFETQEELKIIKQTVALCDLSGNMKISVLFYQRAAEVFTSNFQQLKKEQINKNINVILTQNLEIVNFILQSLTNNKICQQIVGSMLSYLGKFLHRMADWNFEQQLKLNLTYRIISVVLGCNYNLDTPEYNEFIHNVIRCSRFPCMKNQIVSAVINKVFLLASFETEDRTCKAIQIFKSLLNDSLGSNAYNQLVTNYILDLTTNIYIIIIRLKSSFHYIKEFSNVLFLALVFIRNLKMKFTPDQASDNVNELAKQLSLATQKNYYNYPDCFMKKIDNFLLFILNLTSKQDFSDKLKDLLIVLRRGY